MRPFFSGPDARRLAWLGGIALVLAALALNLKVLRFEFITSMDDDINVTLNPHMGGLTLDRLRWFLSDSTYVRRYIPLGWLGLSATYEIGGLDPAAFHAVALSLYVANAALVAGLMLVVLRVFLPEARLQGLSPWQVGAGLLAAGWWAFHPLRVESTAWVSGIFYGQSMALFFCGLLAYLWAYVCLERRRSRLGPLALALGCFAASLLTYPLVLGAPVMLIALDWIYVRIHSSEQGLWKRLLVEKIPFFAVVAGVFAVTLYARWHHSGPWGKMPTWRDFPLLSRISQASYIAVYYLWRPWWPFHLSPVYDTLFVVDPRAGPFVASVLAMGIVTAAAVLSATRHPWLAAIWAAYLAMAFPFFGLTENPHYSSDRYAYFLTVMMAAAMAAGLCRLRRVWARAAASAGFAALLALLGALSWKQERIWSDRRTLFDYVSRHLSNQEMLGATIARQSYFDFIEGHDKAAKEAVQALLLLHPSDRSLRSIATLMKADTPIFNATPVPILALLHQHLGIVFAKSGSLREADDQLTEALRVCDRNPAALYDRSLVLLQMGDPGDALHDYLRAEACSSPPLASRNRQAFFTLFAQVEDAAGNRQLAQAARWKSAAQRCPSA